MRGVKLADSLVAVAITVIVVMLGASLMSEPKGDQSLTPEIRVAVDQFMVGEPVNPAVFPWYNPETKRVRQSSLESALDRGEITQEEFDAFLGSRFDLLWQRRNIVAEKEE